MSQHIVVEGRIAVRAVIESDKRDVYIVYIQVEKADQFRDLIALTEANNLPVAMVDFAFISNLAQGQSHGGIIALAGRRRYGRLDQIAMHSKRPFVAMLDGIEDPYNLGQALRALYAAGAHGVVIRRRDWHRVAGIIIRSSAGASERIAIAQVKAPMEAIDHFRKRGLQIACTANRPAAHTVHHANLRQPLFVFIGGEKRGTSSRIIREADILIRIPYARQFAHSLGATSATSIIAFEVARQRGSL